jgi:deoxyadenosine/deoxycytidine kinase
LENPLRHIALEQFNYVAFEGNIGAGKTTLATKIAEDFNAKTVLRALCGQSLSTKVL